MAKLKHVKIPAPPKVPKKPKASASLATKEKYIKRINDLKAGYKKAVNDAKKKNAEIDRINKKDEAATKAISGIGKITATGGSIRRPGLKRKAAKKHAPKKAGRKNPFKKHAKRRR